MRKKEKNETPRRELFQNQPIAKPSENIGLDGNRNPQEDVDTIKLTRPVSIYSHDTKTR